MPTKTDTQKNGSKAELSPAQLTAADCLATGSSVKDAAAAVKVTRQTVSEWLNQDAAFQAELNRRRAELWSEQADRLRSLLPKALTTIERAIEEGGAEGLKAALAIIRHFGKVSQPTFHILAGILHGTSNGAAGKDRVNQRLHLLP